MQVTPLDISGLAEVLDQSSILEVVDHGGIRMYVLEFDGQDILAFLGMSDEAIVVYPPESFDAESGGSIHAHARAISRHRNPHLTAVIGGAGQSDAGAA